MSSLPGRDALLDQIADAVSRCQPPHVFGVHGDWGSGKTSFMCALEKRLRGCCRRLEPNAKLNPPEEFKHISVVWFEAWRYQHEPAPIVALLHELCAQLPIGQKATGWLKKLAYAGFRGLIDTIKEITIEPKIAGTGVGSIKLNNPLTSIVGAGEKYEEEHFSSRLTSEGIREVLDNAIAALLDQRKGQIPRVLVIVDDLDRCEPDAAYRLLEGIKIYLNIPSCVFLLGINQRHINRAIGDLLGVGGKPGEAERRGSEYLEKLCSVIWKLPVSASSSVGTLMTEWLRPTLDGKLSDDYPLPHALIALMVELDAAFDCLPTNPRKLKAFCNATRFLCAKDAVKPAQLGDDLAISKDDADALIVAASLYTFHPELLARMQASVGFYGTLLEFSLTGFLAEDRQEVAAWMSGHDAFMSLRLPWRNANQKRQLGRVS